MSKLTFDELAVNEAKSLITHVKNNFKCKKHFNLCFDFEEGTKNMEETKKKKQRTSAKARLNKKGIDILMKSKLLKNTAGNCQTCKTPLRLLV